MIRELGEQDRLATIAFLNQAPDYNLYLLGNIRSIGIAASELSQFWGDFADGEGLSKGLRGELTGKLRGVLNRYMNGWVVYGNSDADWSQLGQIVDEHPVKAERIQDNPGGISSFLPYISQYQMTKSSSQTFMSLSAARFMPADPRRDIQVRRATVDDLPALSEFYSNAGHMSRSIRGVKQPIERTRLWLAERDGEIYSAALTNAETAQVAMIGGVYTPDNLRANGYSRAVCSALCQDLLSDGKRPVLYWETPAAGAVYKRLGFEEIGKWRSVRVQPIA